MEDNYCYIFQSILYIQLKDSNKKNKFYKQVYIYITTEAYGIHLDIGSRYNATFIKREWNSLEIKNESDIS